MADGIERDLAAMFRVRADSTPDIPVPAALLARKARRERSHRSFFTATAVAATVAVLVGVTTVTANVLSDGGRDDVADAQASSDPNPQASDSAKGPGINAGNTAPSQIPYIANGTLHVGATTVKAPPHADQIAWGADTVIVTDVAYESSAKDSAKSWVLRDGRLVALPFLDDATVSVSLDGTQVVALTYPTPDVTRLTAYDLASESQRDNADIPIEGACCQSRGGFDMVGFDPTGRFFFNILNDTSLVWTPGSSDPQPVTGLPGEITQVSPQGVLAVDGQYGTATRRVLGQVDVAGAFSGDRDFSMPDTTENPIWSITGQNVVYSGDDGPVFEPVDWDAGPIDTDIDLNGSTFTSLIGFEGEQQFLLTAGRGGESFLLRCNIGGGPCDQLQDLGDQNIVVSVFPARR